MGNWELGIGNWWERRNKKSSAFYLLPSSLFLLTSSFFLLPSRSSRYKFTRPQFCPFAGLLFETLTPDYIPFHFYFVLTGADVDVDGGFYGVEIGCFGEVDLFVLSFYGVVCEAAVYIVAVNTNTHS
jgi:hypothetical protein